MSVSYPRPKTLQRLTWRSILLVILLINPLPQTVIAQAKSNDNQATPSFWSNEWPRTNFQRSSVHFTEILSGGPPKDGIPSIDVPKFDTIASQASIIGSKEPVISLEINGDARAYPLRVLTWHEIVNDEVGGKRVAVTYCPLCNAAIVYDATVNGEPSNFGTTGKLRNSDLIMYDRNTENWWQQFEGEAIVGDLTGAKLKQVPSRLESFERFAGRFPNGKVLVPSNERMRQYGANPYVGYDTSSRPFLYNGSMPNGIEPLARVVAVGDKAWSLQSLRDKKSITDGNLVLSWSEGQNSALDTRQINGGRDVGNVVVQRNGSDVAYDVTFAFVFHAFRPNGELIF
ncbi:MAG: DUF3179 domain-containing protein [Alphaproteobacteria bacterium]